jgi:hypothetical protein
MRIDSALAGRAMRAAAAARIVIRFMVLDSGLRLLPTPFTAFPSAAAGN